VVAQERAPLLGLLGIADLLHVPRHRGLPYALRCCSRT
jgi:hypothetical protein